MTSPTPMLAEPRPLQAPATPAQEGPSPASQAGRTPGVAPAAPGVREELESLALLWLLDEGDPYQIQARVDMLADPALDPEDTWAAFEDLVEAVRLREGVATGVLHWSEVADDLTCGEPSAAAHDIACGRVDDAANALLGGGR